MLRLKLEVKPKRWEIENENIDKKEVIPDRQKEIKTEKHLRKKVIL